MSSDELNTKDEADKISPFEKKMFIWFWSLSVKNEKNLFNLTIYFLSKSINKACCLDPSMHHIKFMKIWITHWRPLILIDEKKNKCPSEEFF